MRQTIQNINMNLEQKHNLKKKKKATKTAKQIIYFVY